MQDIYIKDSLLLEEVISNRNKRVRQVYSNGVVVIINFYTSKKHQAREIVYEFPSQRVVGMLFDYDGNRIKVVNVMDKQNFNKYF
jgi:hypothetical protein